jgi:hypothetical protein
MLVYASPRVLADARSIVGEGVVIEELVARAIQVALRRRIDGIELSLSPGERVARPLGARWIAVVKRGPGRLVRRRPKSCWTIIRVVALPDDTP